MKKLLVIFIGLILISACNSPTSKMESDSNLETKLRETVLSDKDSFIMKELTEFDWDSLLIFFKNREIICYVENPRYPGDYSGDTIRMIGKENAIYEIVITDEKSTDGNDWIRLKLK